MITRRAGKFMPEDKVVVQTKHRRVLAKLKISFLFSELNDPI